MSTEYEPEATDQWVSEQKKRGRISPEQETAVAAILTALPEQTSSLSYFNDSKRITEPLNHAAITVIERQIEIFGRPVDPAQLNRPVNDSSDDLSIASKSERVEAWVNCMKAEGRIVPVQESRIRAILNAVPEDSQLSGALKQLVELTPSLFVTLSKDDDALETDVKVREKSDEEIDFEIKLFQQLKTPATDFGESIIIRDFESRIRRAAEEKDFARAWVLDRSLGSFKKILDLETAQDRKKLLDTVAAFVDLDILLDRRNPDPVRLRAADRILAEHIKRPIHRARWDFVEDELARLANNRGRSTNFQLQELARNTLFDAIEILANAKNFKSDSSFDTQIPIDYKAVWRCLNDSLTELLAGPDWRQKESRRPKKREGKEVEFTAQPQAITGTDPSNIAGPDAARRLDELHMREKELRDREQIREHVIQSLSLMAKKKPDQIEQLIRRKQITDVKTLARELKIERTKLYREIIEMARKALQKH